MTKKVEEITAAYTKVHEKLFPGEAMTELFFEDDHFGTPYLEVTRAGYQYTVKERGNIQTAETFQDLDDFFYRFFGHLTFQVSCDFEAQNRVDPSADSRILIFAHQKELMGRHSEEWRRKTEAEISKITEEYPFY
ncbi:Imm63 family immunity protein [uncultured Erythrobacter sp.]|uniref:Imm63 family immunity protein n=1 Tax=uncultured Erythrobacter sp. TaxID=263913 RepID=UPI002635B7BE|nr:Imm63 family immunity protein [uncultured Erythrobacter sp.]